MPALPALGEAGRMRRKLVLWGFVCPRTGRLLKDEYGRKFREGGYKPVARSKPPGWRLQRGEAKVSKWRYKYWESAWWKTLKDSRCYDPSSYAGKTFRRLFRVPRKMFDSLLQEANSVKKLRDKAGPGGGRGPSRIPASMKLLAALYKLGKGCDFITLQQMAQIESSALERWFHSWVTWMAEGSVYTQNVHPWKDREHLNKTMEVYKGLGMPGALHAVMPTCGAPACAYTRCIRSMRHCGRCNSHPRTGAAGSTDGVKIAWNRCPAAQTCLHKTGKDAPVALNFNVTVTHSHEVLHTTSGQPSTRNDKTLAHLDTFMQQLRNGSLLTMDGGCNVSQVAYDLATADGVGRTQVGVYLITDNGYHRWPILQFAPKFSSDKSTLKWAKRMESVRKDSECTYGILKQRFRELRLPSEFRRAITVERVFKTCCHLHNRLLRWDGLDTIGYDAADWVAEDLDEEEVKQERTKLAKLVHRYKHVVPEKDYQGCDATSKDKQLWGQLRLQLIEHFQHSQQGWLKTAVACRDRPHQQPGFSGDAEEAEEGEEEEGEDEEIQDEEREDEEFEEDV